MEIWKPARRTLLREVQDSSFPLSSFSRLWARAFPSLPLCLTKPYQLLVLCQILHQGLPTQVSFVSNLKKVQKRQSFSLVSGFCPWHCNLPSKNIMSIGLACPLVTLTGSVGFTWKKPLLLEPPVALTPIIMTWPGQQRRFHEEKASPFTLKFQLCCFPTLSLCRENTDLQILRGSRVSLLDLGFFFLYCCWLSFQIVFLHVRL